MSESPHNDGYAVFRPYPGHINRHLVSQSSHDGRLAPPNQRSRAPNRSPCEPNLTQPPSNHPIHNIRPNQPVTMRANPHTMTGTMPGDAEGGTTVITHQHAIARLTHSASRMSPKSSQARSVQYSPKHNNGSYGGFPPDDPIAPATTQDAQPHPPHSLRSRTRITA